MATHNEEVVDQFTRQALPYSTAKPIRDREALELLVAAAGAGPEDTVLDVACGPGLVACAFARVARHVTGIDLTPAMLERARTIAADQSLTNVGFQVGDVARLPFADASFSIVVSRFAFHHFVDPGAVLAEMKRVARPGGRIAVADMIASPDPARAEAFHQMEILRDPSHARALPLSALTQLFAVAGLPPPAETPWSFDVEVDGVLERSFPVPGSEATIRRMFADSVEGDAMGLATRIDAGTLKFTYRSVVLTATLPA
jgi:ubiquinone/menaquinone biosynthesis C-methylase UbiE